MTQIKWKDTEACSAPRCPGGQAECEPAMCPQGSQQHHRLGQQGSASRPRQMWSLSTGETRVESCVQCWAPQNKRNVDVLEGVQQRARKTSKGAGHFMYKGRLGELGFFSGEHSGRPYQYVLIPEGGNTDSRAELSSVVPRVRRRGKGHNPKYSKSAPTVALASSQSDIPHGSTIMALTLEKTSPFLTRPLPWA